MNVRLLTIAMLLPLFVGTVTATEKFDSNPQPIGGYQNISSQIAYPEIAWEAGTEGDVLVWIYVDLDGSVAHARIKKGISNTGLNEAVLDGIKQVQFHPATYQGKAVGSWLAITVHFDTNS